MFSHKACEFYFLSSVHSGELPSQLEKEQMHAAELQRALRNANAREAEAMVLRGFHGIGAYRKRLGVQHRNYLTGFAWTSLVSIGCYSAR